ncbi:hypothetical protein ACIBLA_01985 [Streptomyces sp. NPDC050433]|uniref:hypothetical protein n=1 Tax=Streptomyces sp. NPDC050433 TaxID=3365615 RepID=UPI0037970411
MHLSSASTVTGMPPYALSMWPTSTFWWTVGILLLAALVAGLMRVRNLESRCAAELP